jgi:hypothetical protein
VELFNIDNPYYEVWKVGRPSKIALEKRKKYWELEKLRLDKQNSPKCINYKFKSIIPKTTKAYPKALFLV